MSLTENMDLINQSAWKSNLSWYCSETVVTQMIYKKATLKSFSKFTGKDLCGSFVDQNETKSVKTS